MEKAAVRRGAVTIYSHVHSLIRVKDTQGHIDMLQIRAARRPRRPRRPGVHQQNNFLLEGFTTSPSCFSSVHGENIGPALRRTQLHVLPADEDHRVINVGGLKCPRPRRPSGTPGVQHWPSSSAACAEEIRGADSSPRRRSHGDEEPSPSG